MLQKYNLWATNIHVMDNFLEDQSVIDELKAKAEIKNYFVRSEDKHNPSPALKVLVDNVKMAVTNYCIDADLDIDRLVMNNIQQNYIRSYNKDTVGTYLYEPHDDVAEGGYITALYYIDSSYKEGEWCGGELAIYRHLTFADYHKNVINIIPKPNRLVIFPGYVTHRVKPYFGERPRAAITFGWSVERIPKEEPIVI